MGNTCKPMAVSFQCMTKSTTNKKKKKKDKKKIKKNFQPLAQCLEQRYQINIHKVKFNPTPNLQDQTPSIPPLFHFSHIIPNLILHCSLPFKVVISFSTLSFPGGISGKEHACQSRRHSRFGFDPWVGKIPWRRTWQPTPVSLSGESYGQRSLAGYSLQHR